VGKALPCPACGVKFLVTPLPVAAYVPPPPDPILDAAPPPPPTRTLDPKVYPRMQWLPDDVPWGVIATIAGVVVLGIGLYIGARYAFDAVQQAMPARQKGSDGAGATANGQPTMPVTPPAGSAQAVVDAADKFVETISSGVKTPKLFGDTHASCLDERDKLAADVEQLGRQLQQNAGTSDLTVRAAELVLKIDDLAIRWHALPPMTSAERQAFIDRYADRAREIMEGRQREPIRIDATDDTAMSIWFELMLPESRLSSVIRYASSPPEPPANVLEESYESIGRTCRELCRELSTVKTASDCQRLGPLVEQQVAEVNAAVASFNAATNLTATAIKTSELKCGPRLAHEEDMLELVVKHTIAQAAFRESGRSRVDVGQLDLAPEIKQQLREMADRLNEFQASHKRAIHELSVALAQKKSAASTAEAQALQDSPSLRLAGVAAPGAPPLSDSEREAIDSAVRALEARPGTQTALVQLRGGSLEKRQLDEQRLIRQALFDRWHAIDTTDGVVLVLDFPHSVQFLGSTATYARVTQTDESQRAIALSIPGRFEAGQPGRRSGVDRIATSAAPGAVAGTPRRTFDEVVAETIAKFELEFGRDKLLIVTAKGGTERQRQALETEIAALVRPSRRASLSGKEALLIVLPYQGNVDEIADRIRTAKVLATDASKRGILVEFK
jgi:hypothetical protein